MTNFEALGLIPCTSRAHTIGERFGRLEIIDFGKKSRRTVFAICKCDCGNVVAAALSNLTRDTVKSCGCLRRELARERARAQKLSHGYFGHRLYGVWHGMMTRCYDNKHKHFASYGGRGIKVCDRWHSPGNFIFDMDASYEAGMTLDRIENNGNYELCNCRWATIAEQANNRRTNIRIEFNGRTKTIAQWAVEIGVDPSTIARRYRAGKPIG